MSNISAIIKNVRNIMRNEDQGISGDAQRLEQLGWMLFLKIIDDKDQELELLRKGYKSVIPVKFQWRNWAANPEGITGEELIRFVDDPPSKDNPAGGLFSALKNLKAPRDPDRAAIVREVFDGLNNYMKSGFAMRKVVILANPPFGAGIAEGVETNFPQSFRCRESADLFVILMIQLLKPGGRCAIVLPDGCITGDGYKERIREKLLTDCNLHIPFAFEKFIEVSRVHGEQLDSGVTIESIRRRAFLLPTDRFEEHQDFIEHVADGVLGQEAVGLLRVRNLVAFTH